MTDESAFPHRARRSIGGRFAARWRNRRRCTPLLHRYAGHQTAQRLRPLLYLLIVATTFGYGFAFAVFGRYFMVPLLAPVALLALVALWLLPETDRPPTRTLHGAFAVIFIAHLCWPDYLAIALPFLPWITLLRLTGSVLLLVLLVCLSVSTRFRRELATILGESKAVVVMFGLFMAMGLITLPLSADPVFSANRFLSAQIAWTSVFIAGAWVLAQPRNATRFVYGVWGVAVFVSAIGVAEWRMQKIPWRDHIPSLLQVGDDSVLRILQGTERAYVGNYRIQSKFGHSIGLGEFLSLATPFILHIAVTAPRLWQRVAAAATLPLILYVDIRTDSRAALVGLLIAGVVYGFAWGFRRWRSDRESLVGATVVYGAPAAGLILTGSLMFIGRIRKIFLGGGEYQSSTDVRSSMYQIGLEKLLANPIGHGMGRGGPTLGYFLPDGRLTIDTYYVAVALEFGIVGFVAFFGMFLVALWRGGWAGVATRDREIALILPAAVSLLNFVIIKGVYAREENHPFVFMLLALVVALQWRSAQARKAAAQAAPPSTRPTLVRIKSVHTA